MKTIAALLVILSLSIYSCIGRVVIDKPGEFKISKEKFSFIQEYETPENIQLSLGTVGGNIEVKGYEGNRVKVAFVVTKSNGDVLEMTLDELQKYASFVITKEGPNLSIQVKELFKRNMSVGFIVQTPVKSACKISTSGGNLSLENLIGDQEMHTSGGNVHVDGLKGNLNARTSGGNIHLKELVGKADVSTSGGNIHLDDLTGSIAARTSGGNVHAKLNKISQKLFLETNGGSIDCELPEGQGMNLELSGSDIKSNLSNFQGTTSPDRVSGQINGGGVTVRMNCPGGTLRLKFNKLSDN